MATALIAPLVLAAAGSAPVAQCPLDARGVVPEVRVGGRLFLCDLGVALIAPGWSGHRGDQRALSPERVKRVSRAGTAVYTAVLQSGEVQTELELIVRRVPSGVRLAYALTPRSDVEVESVLLSGVVPVAGHAGSTRYVAVGEGVETGRCPADLDAENYIFYAGGAADWLALAAADGPALRLVPRGLSPVLQDDRKFGTPGYGFHAMAGGRRVLKAGETVRFSLDLVADATARVLADAERARRSGQESVARPMRERLRAGRVALDRSVVPVFSRVELAPDIRASFDNPFDPDDVAVDAEVTLPGGQSVSVPGFYHLPMRVERTDGRERLRATGPAGWRVRFTPTRPGPYRVVVRVRDRTGRAQCPPVAFRAVPSQQPPCPRGFVRVSRASPAYFCHDDGSPYFPVGENICWANGPAPIRTYAEWLSALSAAGGNWGRLWLAFNEKGLEWMPQPTPKGGTGTYAGLGRYALDNAWRLDAILGTAERLGVRLMFCLGTYGELKADAGYFNEGSWVSNPYNQANGGPCRTPQEFWTNPVARKLYQRRLRYVLARWGYSPAVFAWEFWNEANAPAPWVKEMAAYLKRHDVNRHLVSTTYGDDAVWRLPEVDFTMTHFYGTGDIADFGDAIERMAREHRSYRKPYFLAEFGIDWRADDGKYDPQGRGQNLHNGLWAGVLSGAAGTPMLWYWDGYVHPKNLYHAFTPVSQFVSRVDWARTRFEPLSGIQTARSAEAPETFTDLEIHPGYGWGRQGGTDYTVRRDGVIEGEPVASTLGSPKRHNPTELHSRIRFHLDMPGPGEFIVTAGTVSSLARLQIRVDGGLRVDEELRAGPEGQGPWKASRYLSEWKVWQSDYDQAYVVPVPAGRHTVTVENADGDWLSLKGYRVTGYRSSRYPEVRALGLRAGRLGLLWLHHKQSTWRAVLEGREPARLGDLVVSVPGFPSGSYRVEWWDTYKGGVTRTDSVSVADGSLRLSPPPFDRDVAAIVRGSGGQ